METTTKKIFLITGCTNGIGYYTTLGIAPFASTLILVSRSEANLTKLKDELTGKFKDITIKTYACEFHNLPMVVETAKKIAAENPQIDVLINNAGTWESKEQNTADGFEYTWTTNYFAPYLLTNYLLTCVKVSAQKYGNARILILGSEGHRQGLINYADMFKFNFYKTYMNTKKADMLWSNSLARELKSDNITVNSIHPGVVATGLWAKLPKFLNWLVTKFMITAEQGAQTTIYLATLDKLTETGKYWDKCEVIAPTPDIDQVEVQNELAAYTKKLLAKYL